MYRAKFMATTAMALMLGLGASAMAAGSGDQKSSGTTMQPGATGQTQPGTTGTSGGMESSAASVEKWRAQADQVIGSTVVTPEGQDIGDVDDLVVNPSDQSVHAIIGVGGFLGMGEKQVAVPADELQMQGEEIVLTQSKQELEQMAEYNGQWKSISGEGTGGGAGTGDTSEGDSSGTGESGAGGSAGSGAGGASGGGSGGSGGAGGAGGSGGQ